jgi:hypothetical protein
LGRRIRRSSEQRFAVTAHTRRIRTAAREGSGAMKKLKIRMPSWVTTAILILLIPVIGYLVVSNVEQTRNDYNTGAQNQEEANLIAFMHQEFDAQHPAPGYQWAITRRDASGNLVCYCNSKGYGWWYSVQKTPDGSYAATQVADTSQGGTNP